MDITIKDAWYDSQDHKVMTAIIDIPSLGFFDLPYTISDYDSSDNPIYLEVKSLLEKYDIKEYTGTVITPEEELAAQIRSERNNLLTNTDKYMIVDYPLTEKEKESIRAYRQSLRDIPQQKGFPNEIEWPEKPSV